MLPLLDPASVDAPVLDPVPVPGLALPALAIVLVLPPMLVLFRRIVRHRALESMTRKRVFAHFEGAPGATVAEAAEALGVDYKTAAHHARVLVELGLLAARRDGRRVRFFVEGRLSRRERERVSVARVPGRMEVLRAVEAGAETRGEIQRRTGLTRSSVRWHVDALLARRLVRGVRDERGVCRLRPYEAAPAGEKRCAEAAARREGARGLTRHTRPIDDEE